MLRDEGYIQSIKPGDNTVLQEGMTFHVIPWMWGVDGDKTVADIKSKQAAKKPLVP